MNTDLAYFMWILVAGLISASVVLLMRVYSLRKQNGITPCAILPVVCLFLYAISLYSYVQLLNQGDTAKVYTLVKASSIVAVAVLSTWMFEEKIDHFEMIGIALIILGVLVLERRKLFSCDK